MAARIGEARDADVEDSTGSALTLSKKRWMDGGEEVKDRWMKGGGDVGGRWTNGEETAERWRSEGELDEAWKSG